jgi:hypothetical protein
MHDPLFTVRVYDTRTNSFGLTIPTRTHQVDGYQKIRLHPNGYLVTVPIPSAGGGFEVYDTR